MTYDFELPVGVVADAKELEYIVALHQADVNPNERIFDASIEVNATLSFAARDVKRFLMSRYGIYVKKRDVRSLIFSGLAGGAAENEYIDIVELLAILIIPYLVHNEHKNAEHDSSSDHVTEDYLFTDLEQERMEILANRDFILSDVLETILSNAVGSTEPRVLTKELLRSIFSFYGELDSIDDEGLLDEMIELASDGKKDPVLDQETFQRALTKDVKLYNPKWIYENSTHFQDVFGSLNEKYTRGGESNNVETNFTFPQLDFLADAFKSKLHFICVLCTFVISYIAYFDAANMQKYNICTSDSSSCLIGQAIVNWFAIMANMMGLGLVMLIFLNLGNNPDSKSVTSAILEGFCGFASAIILVILPVFVHVDVGIFVTGSQESLAPTIQLIASLFLLSLGSILIFAQISNVMRVVLPAGIAKSVLLPTFVFGASNSKLETCIKQAASLKMHHLVKNAHDLHKAKRNNGVSTSVRAIRTFMNYTYEIEKKEVYGGFLWCWIQFLSGKLAYREGIWIHTRIISMMLLQLIATFFIAISVFLLIETLLQSTHETTFIAKNSTGFPFDSTTCFSEFNPSSCYFPQFNNKSTGYATCPVSYSDGCQFDVVPEQYKDLFCTYFHKAVGEPKGLENQFFPTKFCPELIYPSRLVYTYTPNSNQTSECRAVLTACATSSFSRNIGQCILGINIHSGKLLYDFAGSDCSHYEQIRDLIQDGSTFLEKEESILSFIIPQKWLIRSSGYAGICCGSLQGLYNSAVMIPSIVTTTMKYRRGVLPSLKSYKFDKYRKSMHDITFLIGTSLFGPLTMFMSMFLIVSISVFFMFYTPTASYMLSFISLLLGSLITVIIKGVLIFTFARFNFAAFYRKRPVICNIVDIGLECWNLALSASFILMRSVKLILITITYLGRIDRHLLDEDVGSMGSKNFDDYPDIFRKNILVTEAHRHPYIETLGLMYMLKLRHQDDFAKRSGSTWRLLFIFALMPWFRKDRIANNMVDEEEKDDWGELWKEIDRSKRQAEITNSSRNLV